MVLKVKRKSGLAFFRPECRLFFQPLRDNLGPNGICLADSFGIDNHHMPSGRMSNARKKGGREKNCSQSIISDWPRESIFVVVRRIHDLFALVDVTGTALLRGGA
jgi:hypothetical protein